MLVPIDQSMIKQKSIQSVKKCCQLDVKMFVVSEIKNSKKIEFKYSQYFSVKKMLFDLKFFLESNGT